MNKFNLISLLIIVVGTPIAIWGVLTSPPSKSFEERCSDSGGKYIFEKNETFFGGFKETCEGNNE